MTVQFKTREQYDQEDWERFHAKQREIHRRKMEKFEKEGFKCKQKDCGLSFKTFKEYETHYFYHQEEFKKALICNQPECNGLKFKIKKKYFEHVEEHKATAKRKIINSIRAVLLYNKHGLVIDAFEREFKSLNGKAIAYKFLGHDSLYDLMTSIPEVVQVINLPGGQHLLVAVPDEKTQHIAKLVGNQRDNVEGFNRRNASLISRVGTDVKMKIEKVKGFKDKQVSNFVKKQFVELLELQSDEDGILLSDLPHFYEREYGYKIDFGEFGFQSLEEFCFHGLDSVDMELDKFQWKIVEKGMIGKTKSLIKSRVIPKKMIQNIRSLLEDNPGGLTEEEFTQNYEVRFSTLNFRDFSFNSVKELLLTIPDTAEIRKTPGGPLLFPAGKTDSSKSNVAVIEEFSRNIQSVLDGHHDGVSWLSFLNGYLGYYGDIHEMVKKAGASNVETLLKQCSAVCSIKTLKDGARWIYPAGHDARVDMSRVQKAHILYTLHRILSNCNDCRIPLKDLPKEYHSQTGNNLDYLQLGYKSLESMIRKVVDISTSQLQIQNDTLCGPPEISHEAHMEDVPPPSHQELESGWVRIVTSHTPDRLTMQTERMKNSLAALEARMESFYTWEVRGERPERLKRGDLVAALHTDTAWHRARVITMVTEEGMVEIEYLDWGWVARVRVDTLRRLHTQFLSLAWQGISKEYRDLKVVSGIDWDCLVREGRGRGRVQRQESGEILVQLFVGAKDPEIGGRREHRSEAFFKFRDLIMNNLKGVN